MGMRGKTAEGDSRGRRAGRLRGSWGGYAWQNSRGRQQRETGWKVKRELGWVCVAKQQRETGWKVKRELGWVCVAKQHIL